MTVEATTEQKRLHEALNEITHAAALASEPLFLRFDAKWLSVIEWNASSAPEIEPICKQIRLIANRHNKSEITGKIQLYGNYATGIARLAGACLIISNSLFRMPSPKKGWLPPDGDEDEFETEEDVQNQ